nr:hypothetical protein [uncultured Devosia sp.]
MTGKTELRCRCGQVCIVAEAAPLISAECYCNSCRAGAARMATLPGAPDVTNGAGGTPYVLYRKDRLEFVAGQGNLRGFRLKPDAPTRRVVATCCNTPVFTEFQGGHWLSLYAGLWPAGEAPAMDVRTQTGDLPVEQRPDDSVPSGGWPTAKFYGRLLAAWIAMGFRVPEVKVEGPELAI